MISYHIERIRLILKEAAGIRAIWEMLFDQSYMICPYGNKDTAHLTNNPYGCYGCQCEYYLGGTDCDEDYYG